MRFAGANHGSPAEFSGGLGRANLQGDIRGQQIFGDSSQNWQHSLEYRILGASDEVRGRGLSLLRTSHHDRILHSLRYIAQRAPCRTRKGITASPSARQGMGVMVVFCDGTRFGSFALPATLARASIFILDQFDNKHVVPDLEFKFISPEKLP